MTLDDLLSGGKPAMARALSLIERRGREAGVLALLDAAWAAPKGSVIGLTGPPGVGKSTLTGALITAYRAQGRRVGVIAVDPSSARSGGALLGDRARLDLDPDDDGVFMRSMATRGALGGLSALAYPAVTLLRAAFDIVLLETVGVGQSEIAVSGVADTVVLCLQPASGDGLQFMKSGVMETPDLVLVTKGDLGAPARAAATAARQAMALFPPRTDGWRPVVLTVSARSGEGLDDARDAISDHATWRAHGDHAAQQKQADAWLIDYLTDRFGREGVLALRPDLARRPPGPPFTAAEMLADRLRIALNSIY